MNLINRSRNEINFINFNQDYSCISVGTKNGYKIYNCEPFGKCYGKADGGMGIVEMLFCTSLVAQVGAGEQPSLSPRRLQLVNTKRQSTICELNFSSAILAVKLNRKRLVVVLEEKIHIYDISNMRSLHVIDTPPNPKGVVALSPLQDSLYVAYPANKVDGKINIFDSGSLQDVNIVQAHKTPVSAMAFNSDGTRLATASDKGTVIRVYSIPDATLLFECRRGAKPATICSLAFNINSTMLCVSSESDTVHIFKLESKQANRRQSMSFLPEMISGMLEPMRDFAYFKLPTAGVPSLCALSSTTSQVMAVTADGMFFQYNIDTEIGGECSLLKQYSILDSADEAVPNEEMKRSS